MSVLMLIVLQAGNASAGPSIPSPVRLTPACPSTGGAPEDVVVCGQRSQAERYRLRPLPPRFEAGALPKAETRLFGKARLAAETEAGNVGGSVSNRAMVRLKVGF